MCSMAWYQSKMNALTTMTTATVTMAIILEPWQTVMNSVLYCCCWWWTICNWNSMWCFCGDRFAGTQPGFTLFIDLLRSCACMRAIFFVCFAAIETIILMKSTNILINRKKPVPKRKKNHSNINYDDADDTSFICVLKRDIKWKPSFLFKFMDKFDTLEWK